MIGLLRGSLVESSPDRVLLDVGGVGYALHIPLSTFYALAKPAAGEVRLHVYTHVREDALQLFGFATPDERWAFERLLGIAGVGPRLALAVLSGIEPAELERTIRDGDRARLEQVPGIGRKTAERILLELRDRWDRETRSRRGSLRPEGPRPASEREAVIADAVSALVNLGYPRDRAERTVLSVLPAEPPLPPLESVLRLALKALAR